MLPIAILFLLTVQQCCSSRILFIVPVPSYSHIVAINKVVEALLDRGHHVTVLSSEMAQTSSKNYEWLDISAAYSTLRQMNASIYVDSTSMGLIEMYHQAGVSFCETELSMPHIQEWLKRKDHRFDLVVIETVPIQCFYGMVHLVGSPPVVGISTLPAMATAYYAIGNPINPAYLPEVFLEYSDHMTFWQRLHNTYHLLRFLLYWQTTVLPEHEVLMRKYFGPEPPSVFETERNFSMLLVAAHFSGHYPRPNLPNVIEVTGLHVTNKTKPLPQDIKRFMDEAKDGVIYFSLGSNVQSEMMPDDRVKAFIDAFRELPQRVIWKFGGNIYKELPENVIMRKWLPQPDILAHPKVKLFITQGGLQSLNEAAYRAIPLIGIPFFSDQRHNVAKISSAGIGIKLNLDDITKEAVIKAVHTVLDDPRYRENMKQYSKLFCEHQANSVDTAVWWLEYVIRHNGAPHLRSAALDLYWWQLLLLDVIGFLLLVAALVGSALYFATRKVASVLFGTIKKLKKQ